MGKVEKEVDVENLNIEEMKLKQGEKVSELQLRFSNGKKKVLQVNP